MRALRILLPAFFGLGLWQLVVTGLEMRPFILPGPLLVAETLWVSRVLIAENAVITPG